MVKIKYCPECGSSNIDWTMPQTWSKYHCNNCGYTGAFIIEDERSAEKIKKEYLKKQKKIPTSEDSQ